MIKTINITPAHNTLPVNRQEARNPITNTVPDLSEFAYVSNPKIKPVEKILVVGGYFPLSDADKSYLEQTLTVIAESGIPVQSERIVTTMNINPQHGGRDFLAESDVKSDIEPDVIITSFIPSHSPCRNLNDRESPAAISCLHNILWIWRTKANESGARLIFSFGDGLNEINAEHFEGNEFIHLYTEPYRVDVLIAQQFLEDLTPIKNNMGNNELGQAIKRADMKL